MERLGRLICQKIWSVKFSMCQLTWVQVPNLRWGWRKSCSLGPASATLEWGDLFGHSTLRGMQQKADGVPERKHGNLHICQWQAVCPSRQVRKLFEPQFPCPSNGAINSYLIKLCEDYIISEHPLEQAFVQTWCSANPGFIFAVPANRVNTILGRVESRVKWRYVVWRRVDLEACETDVYYLPDIVHSGVFRLDYFICLSGRPVKYVLFCWHFIDQESEDQARCV